MISNYRVNCLKLVCLLTTILFSYSNNNFAVIPPGSNVTHAGPKKVVVSLHLPGDKPLGDFQTVVIPLKRVGRLFLIEARIDDQGGNLIFDTGASGLVLNRTYFRKYATYEKAGGGGITGAYDKTYGILSNRMDLSGLYYEKVAADLADLGHIEDKRGVKILGLFGLNMIDDLEVIFDANNNELRLTRTDREGNRLGGISADYKFDFTQRLETNHRIMLIRGRIGDKVLNFCLDTGAEINVISNRLPKKILSTIQIRSRSNLGGSKAGTIDALYGTMKEFEFGNYQFGLMETAIINLTSMSEAYGCSIDGMLGYDFWQKGVFCFNFKKNEISFSAWKGGVK